LSLQAPLAQPLLVSGVRLAGEQVNNGLLVPIFQGEMAVLSAEDGSQSFSLPVSLKSSPLLVGDDMYMAESTGYLHMYNTHSGKRIWSHKISSHALMGPVLFDGSLWLTDNQGSVFRINMNGEIEDTIQLAGSIAREPLLTQEGLIIRTDRGVMALVK